ncbi:MAG: N-acetyl-gamma-glutamyl-phosphate reductase [Gammaproteobacteria bacterium]|nr:N-acetyl-gamma-glutamyl-phosphate reductase [Gammaproteobacteria bacterium]
MSNTVGILHGAGYTGGELIRLLLSHPDVTLSAVTSRAFAGEPLWASHPALRGMTDLVFTTRDEADLSAIDVVFAAAEHGQGANAIRALLAGGFDGRIIDLSADFRFKDAAMYPGLFNFEHPEPRLLNDFVYGLPEVAGAYPSGTRFIANPGCFATAITVALWPLATNLETVDVRVIALTGASGSGAQPKPTTHYPTRDGNVRAYKVFVHQHQPEIEQTLGPNVKLSFVPVSGPWTRGIWGTAQITLPDSDAAAAVAGWFESAYGHRDLIRLWPNQLPELRYSVNTPFCDVGWVVDGHRLVVGFAIDNLLKGAASQAVQNMNLILGIPETRGLVASDVTNATSS